MVSPQLCLPAAALQAACRSLQDSSSASCRSWRGSSEQLQWQVADLQRKLKDSEQRSTLWARRAGAAEARVPVQATSARLPLYQGLLPQGPGLGSASAVKTGLLSILEGPISRQAGLMGKPGNAIESAAEVMGGTYIKAERGSAHQRGMPEAGQQVADEEDHEEGCAMALLQEALSEAPGKATIQTHKRRATTYDDSPACDGARHMQMDESGIPSVVQSYNSTSTAGQLSALQQRIAEYKKQHGLAALQGPAAAQLCDDSNESDGVLNGSDKQDSPLKQRIAEYTLNADHLVCRSGRAASPTFSSRLESSHRTKLDI